MNLDTLKDLYVSELKDLYSAERQLVKAIPKMIKATRTPAQGAFRTTSRKLKSTPAGWR
jgi:Uncharacterized protein conserved in bacteria